MKIESRGFFYLRDVCLKDQEDEETCVGLRIYNIKPPYHAGSVFRIGMNDEYGHSRNCYKDVGLVFEL